MITATSSPATAPIAGTTSSVASATNAAGAEDRFLKLLVAQLSNQDPMNPLDNAQMTSQMAQISTVSSVQQVNQTLQGLAAQLSSMQIMQASTLVGREVLFEGSRLSLEDGKGGGAIDLAGRADTVKIEILSAAGQVVDSFDLGPRDAGRHSFNWDATGRAALGSPSYRVSATRDGSSVSATPLARARVESVGNENGNINVGLRSLGNLAYSAIKAIL